jgi:hypothetical protein
MSRSDERRERDRKRREREREMNGEKESGREIE